MKYITIFVITITLVIINMITYNNMLLIIKENAWFLFFTIILMTYIPSLIKNKNLKESFFNFNIILWASFWFLSFEASYIPLYETGECISGKKYSIQEIKKELESIKINRSFGFHKYDMEKYFPIINKLQYKTKYLIIENNDNGYTLMDLNGSEQRDIKVYEDINFEKQDNCSFI